MSGIFDQDGNIVYSVSANIKMDDTANENQSLDAAHKPGRTIVTVKPAAKASGAGPAPVKANKGEEAEDSGFKLEFTNESMVNGIILSELLGKPKILQKRRW